MHLEPPVRDDDAVWRTRVYALEAQAHSDAREIETLKLALVNARKIGAAIGVLMTSLKVTDDDAFAVLKQASQDCNRKLRDVADDVVLTGCLPAEALPRKRSSGSHTPPGPAVEDSAG